MHSTIDDGLGDKEIEAVGVTEEEGDAVLVGVLEEDNERLLLGVREEEGVLVEVAVGDGVELGFIDGDLVALAVGVFGLPVGEGELLGGGAYKQDPPHSHIPLAKHKHSLSLPSRTKSVLHSNVAVDP